MHTLTGTPASAGVAIGPLVVIGPAPVVAGGRIGPEQADAEIARLAAHEKVQAIGETGLDYYRESASPADQIGRASCRERV
jgi:PEP-utilising enzyme, N-terminal.